MPTDVKETDALSLQKNKLPGTASIPSLTGMPILQASPLLFLLKKIKHHFTVSSLCLWSSHSMLSSSCFDYTQIFSLAILQNPGCHCLGDCSVLPSSLSVEVGAWSKVRTWVIAAVGAGGKAFLEQVIVRCTFTQPTALSLESLLSNLSHDTPRGKESFLKAASSSVIHMRTGQSLKSHLFLNKPLTSEA